MPEELVDRESGADEIVARESFNEEGSVEDIFGNCPPYEPPSAGDAKRTRMKLRNHESVTVTLSRLLTKLVLALWTVRLARTCVRPLPARPVERPD